VKLVIVNSLLVVESLRNMRGPLIEGLETAFDIPEHAKS
jgi:hypothetical protein